MRPKPFVQLSHTCRHQVAAPLLAEAITIKPWIDPVLLDQLSRESPFFR
jgi:hypothetical protein